MSRQGFWVETSEGVVHICSSTPTEELLEEALAVAEAAMAIPAPQQVWAIEMWDERWHPIVSGTEAAMRCQLEKLKQPFEGFSIGRYRLLDSTGIEISNTGGDR